MNDTEVNRRIVADGLALRRVQWQEEEKEAQQERYEQDMISACNLHCADAKKEREKKEEKAARRAAVAQAKANRGAGIQVCECGLGLLHPVPGGAAGLRRDKAAYLGGHKPDCGRSCIPRDLHLSFV